MPRDEWHDENKGRDNTFHRRVSEVRNKTGFNINEAEALDLIQNPNKPNPFAVKVVKETLSDDEVDRRAFFDNETVTFNFRYMLRTFRRELARARRYKRALSLCVVAIDGYAEMLHRYGVLAAEQALTVSAELLIRTCRSDVDMVGRYADGRFILLLPETPGIGAAALGDRIRHKFSQVNLKVQWYQVPLTVSIGISHFPAHGGEIEELIAQADLAAEMIEEKGGNATAFAPEDAPGQAS